MQSEILHCRHQCHMDSLTNKYNDLKITHEDSKIFSNRNMFVRIDTRHSMSFMTWLSLNWKHEIHISWLVCRHKHNLKCLYVPGFDKSLTPSHRKPLHYLLIMPLMIGCLRILKNYYYTCHQCCTNSQFRFYQATAMVNRYAINNTKSLVSKLLKICID